jgi:Malectin domain
MIFMTRMIFALPILVSHACLCLGFAFAAPAPEVASSPAPVRINCGGGVYTDSLRQVWAADNSFVGGSAKAYPVSQPVSGTNDDKLFQSERFAQTLIYQIPLAKGIYDVTLNFAEMYWNAAGKRVFSLSLEGQTVIQNLDIWATVGQYTALPRTFTVAVNDGVLDIVGNSSIDNAQLAAIEVKPGVNPTPTPTPTPTPPTGIRVAISQDGNYHDRDDICSSAIETAIWHKSGRADNIVYWGYADHYWLSNASWETDMLNSISGGVSRFGPFPNAQIYNTTASHMAAVQALTSIINASGPNSPLHLLENGPAQVIGEAIQASSPSARQYVTVYSQSLWNDNHAKTAWAREGLQSPYYIFDQFAGMGVNVIHIEDQDTLLKTTKSPWFWLRDSPDPDLQWLWSRNEVAWPNRDRFDCSGAGLIYYEITGDAGATPAKLKAYLTQ